MKDKFKTGKHEKEKEAVKTIMEIETLIDSFYLVNQFLTKYDDFQGSS